MITDPFTEMILGHINPYSVDTVFLTGSIADGLEHSFSDIDYIAISSEEDLRPMSQVFQEKKIELKVLDRQELMKLTN